MLHSFPGIIGPDTATATNAITTHVMSSSANETGKGGICIVYIYISFPIYLI